MKSTIRYSESFKEQVVRSIERGDHSIRSASIHYGIGGSETIRSWIKKRGKLRLLNKIVRVETPEDQPKFEALKAEIEQLKAALIKSQVEGVVSDAYLKVACRKLGLDIEEFKKKADAKRSPKP